MEQVLRLIADYQWWIYGLFGLLLLFYLWRAFAARREGARSIFRLEQEQARARYSRSAVMAALILIVMAAVFGASNFLLPEMTRPVATPTPTVTAGPLARPTLTATSLPPTMTPTATATRERPTRVRPPTPTSEVVATNTPVVRPPSCPNPNVRITSPGVNQRVTGNVAIRGTAQHPDFQYYKIEVGQGSNPGSWTVVGQLRKTPVSNGLLETFNSDAYPAGTYTLRLVVVDQTGNFPEPCHVTIVVQ